LRIKAVSEAPIPAGTTKTVTMYAPQGFRVVTAGYDYTGDAGDLEILASKPTMDDIWLEEGMSNFPLADGATAKTVPSEGWVFEVRNVSGSTRHLLVHLIAEEGEVVTTHYYNGGVYPVTIA
jgi:hypothetical protein